MEARDAALLDAHQRAEESSSPDPTLPTEEELEGARIDVEDALRRFQVARMTDDLERTDGSKAVLRECDAKLGDAMARLRVVMTGYDRRWR